MSLPTTPALPPTPRDFDIHKMHLVQFSSTRTIAKKHGISQTRVRQVVQRVSQWLAAALPVKTELEQEQETRLAQHLAADQLRNQLEDLRILWDGTHDPKYFRQQTRVITALARLGIVPGSIEVLAADATTGPLDPSEPQPPWSEDDPWANSNNDFADPSDFPPSPPLPVSPSPQSAISPPPLGACSPSSAGDSDLDPAPVDLPPATASPTVISESQQSLLKESLQGLKLMEQRLLTLLENVNPTDTERRRSLDETLRQLRSQQAILQIRLSPNLPGASLDLANDSLTPNQLFAVHQPAQH